MMKEKTTGGYVRTRSKCSAEQKKLSAEHAHRSQDIN